MIARGYSWNEWQRLSPAERQRIFQERDRLNSQSVANQQNRSVATMQTALTHKRSS